MDVWAPTMCINCGARRDTLRGSYCQRCRDKKQTQRRYVWRMRSRNRRGQETLHATRVEKLLMRDGLTCGVCKLTLTDSPQIDYIVRNGNVKLYNLQLVHEECFNREGGSDENSTK
jgi:5-methylcytosine-specific restriction endonuclease McrA